MCEGKDGQQGLGEMCVREGMVSRVLGGLCVRWRVWAAGLGRWEGPVH